MRPYTDTSIRVRVPCLLGNHEDVHGDFQVIWFILIHLRSELNADVPQ
jgi:hypothetical protein